MSSFSNKRRLPSLNALRAFESAARHLSLKDAAEELNVSQSAVSHQVKALEEFLGVALFERKTRGVELTRKGRLYYPVLRTAFDSIAEGTRSILDEHSAPIITVQVYSTFTTRWLLPRLAKFQDSQNELKIRLQTSQQDVNFEHTDVDAAILIGQPNQAGLHYDYLFDCELTPVCSVGYLEKHGPISTPLDMAQHTLLQVYPSAGDWYMWLEANQVEGVNPNEGLQLESYEVSLSSAAQGMGISLGQQPYISEQLQAGSLVELFPNLRVRNPNRWFLAYRGDSRQREKMSPFYQWLAEEIQADNDLLVLPT